MKRQILALTLILLSLAVLLFVTCTRQKEPIKIGLSVTLSGPGGAPGEHIRDGALQAVEEINLQGGINGRLLQLLVRDDRNNEHGIRLADEFLIEEEVVAIIGHSQSANTLTAYPYVTSQGTILMTAYTSVSELSGRDDLFLRTSVDCDLYGVKTAALLHEKDLRSVAFLIDMSNPAFGNAWVEQTERHFQGKTHVVRFHSAESPDWPQISEELLATVPDVIFLLTESSASATVAQFIRQRNTTIPLMASVWAQSRELINIGGKSVEGMTLISFVNPENSRPDYQEFSRKLEQNFGKKASARSARAYEMVTILADALGRLSVINTETLKAALLAGEYESLLGKVKFDPFGDVVRPVYEFTVNNGAFTTVGEIR